MADDRSIDFLKQQYQLVPSAKQERRKKKILKIFGAIFIVTALCGTVFSYTLTKSTQNSPVSYEGFSLLSSLRTLVGSGEKKLNGENDDRINMLLLGIGGEGHDGPELTDTIMFASFQPSTNNIGLLSIPRDLAVPIPNYGYQKINHINAYGEIEEPGSGAQWSSNLIGELLDQEIQYYVKVDFDGFTQLIDDIGGIDVYVERSFSDSSYPLGDQGLVESINFEQGWQHMDGETALKFARSRHGTNGEGSDFARAERQQKILLAVKDELLSASTFLNPSRLNNLIETFQENVDTNMSFWEIMKFARYIPEINTNNINTVVLGDDGETLYSTTINGSFVLLPKKDDWSSIKTMANNILSSSVTEQFASDETEQTNTYGLSKVRVEIQNGTGVSGLAFQASQMLSNTNFSVVNIGNADSESYEKTIIYDLTGGTKTQELQTLKEFLEADVAMTTSGWIFSDTVVPRELTVGEPQTADSTIDFLVILGQNATNLVLQ